MANNKFIKAVKKAKGLYRSGRYKTFADAVKAAYKTIGRAGNDSSRGAGHTSTATRANTTGNRTATKTITANVKIGRMTKRKATRRKKKVAAVPARRVSGITSAKKRLVNHSKEKVDNLVLRIYHTVKKRIKRKLRKQLTAAKAELRKYL